MTARLIMKLRVVDRTPSTEDVAIFTFRHPWRTHLPPPQAGSHVDLRLPDGRTRQYSLCGDPADSTVYKIAVKREDKGRGVSRWIHENLTVGATALVSTPRNNFPLVDHADRHVLIAGGIGVTPFVAMAHALARQRQSYELHFCAHAATAPLIDEIRTICSDDALTTYFSDARGARRFDPERTLAMVQPNVHVYCCGPARLTDAVRAATTHWPESQIHFEVFKPTLDENFNPEPFDIHIASTNETLRVPANKSALEVLREHGLPLASSCELGVCGSCECSYRDGIIIHRDSVLSVGARQDRMMLCVSRARVAVTLDL
jgi:vanillate O-demethylase ferredoxin subunit